MSRIIMFAGAHRSGKTTLAEKVAGGVQNGRFQKTNTLELIKEHGFDMFTSNIDEAMAKQRMLFDHHYQLFTAALESPRRETVVFDRSLLDYLAYTYMMFDITTAQSMTALQRREAGDLIEHMEQHCDLMKISSNRCRTFIVEPLSIYVAEEGKPREFAPSQQALNAIMKGLYHRVTGHPIQSEWNALVPSASLHERSMKVWQELDRGRFLMADIVRGLLSM